ncbi:MAG: carotenoid oxygenase family protein, partial [Halobacteriales archaeon]|nr:carotenoid oxygenase family protein [Halobacteriales archaeon]
MATYSLGFRSVEDELIDQELPVEGTVPDWLSGSLIRNGPGRFEVGEDSVAHWFDGLAMLTRFDFDAGTVRYSNRFLRSDEYAGVMGSGAIVGSQFGTNRSGLLGAIRDLVIPKQTDNANVNVMRIGDRFVAITETQVGVEFDPQTLETVGQYRFPDLDGQMMTAHPHLDPLTGETVTMTTEFGRRNYYRFYRRPRNGDRFLSIGAIEADRPAYVHSFGLTVRFIVLVTGGGTPDEDRLAAKR